MPELSRAPSQFCCAQCRSSSDLYGERYKRIHDNTRSRTGRERKAKGNRNIRMLGVHLEYVCTCGYRGWSKHMGTLRLPHNGEVPVGPLFMEEVARLEHGRWAKAGREARKHIEKRRQ